MAKLFLESTDTSYKVSNSGTKVYGTTGDQAIVIDGSLTGVEINSNVERVQFTGSTTDYTYKVVGTDLEVYSSTGTLVTKVGVQDDTTGTKLTFANGTVDAKITGLNAVTVGGQAVSATAATGVTIPATAIDSTLASAPAPVFSVSAPTASVTEAAGAVATYTVSLNAAQPTATSVSYALGNVGTASTADYGTAALTAVTGGATAAAGVLTFPAGVTTATITVPVTVDTITETGEGVSLNLSAPSTGATVNTATAQVLINDPPTPVFSLAASATAVGEGTPAVGTTAAVAAGTITLTVTRTGNTAGTDTVAVQATGGTGTNGAISASDFTALSQTVTFAPAETTKTVTFTTIADSTREGDETLTVSLGTPSTGASISTAAGASSVTLTITNDDPNLLPVITTPTTTPSAFIGDSTAVTGVSFTDGDDNTGFSVTVQAAGSSQVSFSSLATSVTAKNAANTPMSQNETANTIVLSGTKADLNTTLAALKYTTNSTVPTSEQVVITITDSAGGVATKTLPINIGTSKSLASPTTVDSLVGSAGDDQFSGTLVNFNANDIIQASTGTDKLTLTTVTGALPTLTTAATGIEILDLTTSLAAATNEAVSFSAANFGSTLTTVNFTTNNATTAGTADTNDTLTATTANTGTVFNMQNSAGLLAISAINGTATTTDAFTVNLAGGTTLTSLTSGTDIVDILNVNSNGTTANTITLTSLSTNATVNAGGAQEISFNTLPNLGTGVFNGASATGKITVTANSADSAAITGGSAGDVLTGDAGLDTILGGAGNDTINGGAGVDSITGGTGADSLTGGLGNDRFVFTLGDSGSTSTTRDTIADLAEGDTIQFGGYGITGLTNGQTIATSAGSATAKEIYIDTTNSRIVIETAVDGSTKEEIAIPASVASASFTYNYGADAIVGTSDDYITVGAAPLTSVNNQLGTLTLTGKAISDVTVVLNDATPPTVGGVATGSNAVRALVATNVTNKGVVVSGSSEADTITGTAQADTINGGAGADVLTGGASADSFTFTTTSTSTPSATNFDTITDFSKVAGATTFDVISATAMVLSTQTAAAGSGVATITAGVATFNAADTTLAAHIAAVAAAQQGTAGATTIWQEGSDSYLYISDGTLAVAGTDVLIKLTGLTAGALTVAGNAITAIA